MSGDSTAETVQDSRGERGGSGATSGTDRTAPPPRGEEGSRGTEDALEALISDIFAGADSADFSEEVPQGFFDD